MFRASATLGSGPLSTRAGPESGSAAGSPASVSWPSRAWVMAARLISTSFGPAMALTGFRV